MQNKPSHQGFTLVELMLILAVLGILMAIAVPAYQNYTIRSKVSECLSMANSAQTAVGFRRQVLGRFPGNDAEAQFEFNGGRFCEDIQIAEGGTIQMFTRNTGAAIDPIIQLTPDSAVASFNWNCELLDGSPSHVPSLCRNPGVPAPVGGGNPGSGNPGSGNPGSGNPGSGNPGSGNPGSGNPGSGNPGSGNPGSGNPGSGNPGSGNPGSGNPGSGNPGSGNPGSGNPGSGNPGSGNPGSGNPGSGNPGSGNPGSGNPGDGTTPPEGETPDPGPSIPELPEPLPEPDPEPPGLDDPNDVMACQGNMRLPQCQCLNRFCRWFPASSSSCPWNQQTPNIPANCRN